KPMGGLLFAATGIVPGDAHHIAPVFAMDQRLGLADGDQLSDGIGKRFCVLAMVPMDPADFAVLGIAIVIAMLGAAELVARQQHGRAMGEEERREEIALLPLADGDDVLVVGLALGAIIIATVVVVA